jgi:hypothetical protein
MVFLEAKSGVSTGSWPLISAKERIQRMIRGRPAFGTAMGCNSGLRTAVSGFEAFRQRAIAISVHRYCLGRRCLSRIIWTNGGQHRSWSAEYFLHSRCQWEPQQLFQQIFKRALAYRPQRLVGGTIDDTRLRRPGNLQQHS